jgi:hypothetical protein
MASRKPFSQYLAEAKNKYGVANAPAKQTFTPIANAPATKKGTPEDFLSTAIDIASRPLYGVTETIQSAAEWAAKAQTGEPYDVAAEVGKTISAPIRGLLSTNKDDKPMTSDLIEQVTDVVGNTRSGYVNVKDNLDPVAKGVIGFAGDVALDPLTYIPLAGIAAVATKASTKLGLAAAKGAKATGEIAPEVIDAAEAISKQADVAKTEGKAPTVVPPAEAQVVSDLQESVSVPAKAPKPVKQEAPAPVIPASVDEQIAAAPMNKKLQQTLKSLIKPIDEAPTKVAEKVAKAAAPASVKTLKGYKTSYLDNVANGAEDVLVKIDNIEQPLSSAMAATGLKAKQAVNDHFARFQYLYGKTGGRVDEANRLINTDGITAGQFLEYKAMMDPTWVGAKIGEKYITAGDIAKMVRGGAAPSEIADVVGQVSKNMPDELAAMQAKYATQPTSVTPKAELKIDPFGARFRSTLETAEGAKISKLLGKQLTANLKRRAGGSAGSFEGAVQSLLKLLNNQRSLNNFVDAKSIQAIDRAVMDLLGIDVAGTNLARRQAVSTVGTAKGARIADAVDNGLTAEDGFRLAGFNDKEAMDLAKLIAPVLKKFTDVTGYKAGRSATGVALKKTKAGTIGKREREFNTRDAWTVTKLITNKAAELADSAKNEFGRKLYGRERADYVKQYVMRRMAMTEAMLDQMGIPLWMGVGANRVQLSMTQAVSILNELDSDLVNMVLFNAGTRTVTTNIYDAVAEIVRRGDDVTDAELTAILRKSEGEGVYNAFVSGGKYHFANKAERAKTKNRIQTVPADKIVERTIAVLREGKDTLRATNASNAANYLKRFNQEASDLSNEVITKLVAFMNDPLKVADALKLLDNYVKEIDNAAKSEWAMDLSKIAAKIGVTTRLPFGAEVSGKAATRVRKTAQAAEKEAPKAPAAEKAAKTQKAVQEDLKAPADEAAKVSDEAYQSNSEFGRETAEEAASTKAHGAVMGDVIRRMNPLLTMFSRHHGMETISEVIHDMSVGFKELRGNFTRRLNILNKKHSGLVDGFGVSKISKVFNEIQRGMKSSPEDEVLRADLENVISELFDHTKANSLSDLQSIGGLGPDVFADYLRQVKLHEIIGRDREAIFDLEKFNKMVKDGEATDMWDAMSREWTQMDIKDPIDFLGRWQAALIMANTDGALAHGALSKFREIPGAVVNKKTPGYVRLDEYGGKLGPFIPSKTFVREDLADQFQRMSEFVSEARVAGGPVGEWLQKTLFPLQDTWKYLITLPRPGHHIRNMIGDASLTFMAEGVRYAHKAGVDAFKVMAYGRRNYTDMDLLAALRKEGVDKLPTNADVISNGKYGEVRMDEFYEELNKRGLLPKFFITEDIEATAQGALKRGLDKVSFRGGKAEEFLGTISEGRDHYARIQHALQYMYKMQKPGKFDPKFASKEAMFEAMAKQVKRYHPDSSMLTPFEAKYLRPIIPFYSWLRGALPAIVVSAAIRPGRAMVFPKASYNMAVAMGVDPNSLSDPFPDDQLFPEFITKQATGPIAQFDGKYYTINPGIANIDVSNDFGTDPVKAMLGMISPILRLPVELATGTKLDTGSKIKDVSEYLDSNIPGINYVSNISGYSTTGSIAGILSGQGPDIQRAVEKGTKEDSDKVISFVNWMTGLGLGNISKQNLIDLAEIEKRNREGVQRAGF